MSVEKKNAPERKHLIDGPPRLNSTRCASDLMTTQVFSQSSGGRAPKAINKPEGGRVGQELIAKREIELSAIEQVVMQGDLSKLNPEQRVTYYRKVCESAGLNPFTNPFAYINLNGKLCLYAKKDCTEQLRKINGVSIEELEDKLIEDIYVVTAKAKDKNGRVDQAKGAVVVGHLKGEAKANAIMKAETKAKRRVTLSICGMGWTDESEIDSIPNARPVEVDYGTGEIKAADASAHSTTVLLVAEQPKLSPEQVSELDAILGACDEKYRKWVYDYVKKTFKTESLSGVGADMYERMKSAAVANMEKHYDKQRSELPAEPLAEVAS